MTVKSGDIKNQQLFLRTNNSLGWAELSIILMRHIIKLENSYSTMVYKFYLRKYWPKKWLLKNLRIFAKKSNLFSIVNSFFFYEREPKGLLRLNTLLEQFHRLLSPLLYGYITYGFCKQVNRKTEIFSLASFT